MLILYLALLLGALVATAWLAGRARPGYLALAWVLVPLLLMPLWLQNSAEYNWTWFLLAKAWSVILACAFLSLAVERKISPRVVSVVLWLFLCVNILEAVAVDWSRGSRLNAIAGVVLIVCMGRAFAPRPHHAEVAIPLGWPWIASYVAWNACFVYHAFPVAFGQTLMVLLAAVILAAWKGQEYWLSSRATTLGLYLLAYCSLFGPMQRLSTAAWFHPEVGALFAMMSLLFAMLMAGHTIAGRFRRPVTAS